MNRQTLRPPPVMEGLHKAETYRYYERGMLRQATIYVLTDAAPVPDRNAPQAGQGRPNKN